MGAASLATLALTGGHLDQLVTMYSINVFVTFSLSQAEVPVDAPGAAPPPGPGAPRVHLPALLRILIGIGLPEVRGGRGWVTIVVTGAVVALCFRIRRH